jgi:hypothetical protein
MKVSGFTFVKNAVKYGYPLVESITSVLPLVDEMIVCHGDSDDETEALLHTINSNKLKIVHSVWNAALTNGGAVLAAETNKAIDATGTDADWLLYIQADEVLHEEDYAVISNAMQQYKDELSIDGLLFKYRHFFGSYKFIADSRGWYSREIRIIRNNKGIRSYRDAQGFRWADGRKLKVKEIDAHIYHYGWVRSPLLMYRKTASFEKLWGKQYSGSDIAADKEYDYSDIDSVALFEGVHPAVMLKLVAAENWQTGIDPGIKKFRNFKSYFLYFLQKKTGWRPFEYRNYIKV